MRLGLPVRIGAAAAVLALALTGLVVREGMARAAGQEVRLRIQGYDPRGLLTGHYVQFQIIDEVGDARLCAPLADPLKDYIRPDQRGWVALREVGGRHRAVGVARTRAEALKAGPVAVRGAVDCTDATLFGPEGRDRPQRRAARLDLGIERMHMDQAQAEAAETALRVWITADQPLGRSEAAYALMSVGDDGKARLTGLHVGGRRIALDWF